MLRKLLSDVDLVSDTAMEKVEMLGKQNERQGKKEKPKSHQTEEAAEEKEEMISPKVKKVKKKAGPSQDDIISPKNKSSKKSKEPCEKTIVSPKTKKVIKN